MSSSPSPSSSASPPIPTVSPPSPSPPAISEAPPHPRLPSSQPPLSSPPPNDAPSQPVPSRSQPPAASRPPPSTAPPPPSGPSAPTTPNAPPPSPSPHPMASQPSHSRAPPTGTRSPPLAKPPTSSPSPPPTPAPSSPPLVLPGVASPPSSPPSNSSATPNPPGISTPSLVTPPGTAIDHNTSSSHRSSGFGGMTGYVVAIGVVAVLIAFSLVGFAVCIIRKRRKAVADYNAGVVMPSSFRSSMSESSLSRSTAPLVQHRKSETTSRINSLSESPRAGTTLSFSYEELYKITNGFSPQNILGEGGFGSVYKGCLPDGQEVAVKRLKIESRQGDREFKAEVEIISRVHHRHLVSLVGYCISYNQRLLVYDFVPNGTLESHLHGKNTRPVMDWATRVKVAAGAVRGIAYLHEDCNPKIIHRDIKSSNILLDNNFEAQVSDFGLARLALELDACTHVTTRVMGTFGYLAPEYASSGKLTEKSDVFSLGVVLLELITGQKPVDNTRPLGDESLVEWARPLLPQALKTGELGELPDPRLQRNFDKREMFRMIEAAAACTRHSASMRPQMGKVGRFLDSLADIDLTSGITPGQSKAFNVANSADIRIFQQLAYGNPGSSSDYSHSDWSYQNDV